MKQASGSDHLFILCHNIHKNHSFPSLSVLFFIFCSCRRHLLVKAAEMKHTMGFAQQSLLQFESNFYFLFLFLLFPFPYAFGITSKKNGQNCILSMRRRRKFNLLNPFRVESKRSLTKDVDDNDDSTMTRAFWSHSLTLF